MQRSLDVIVVGAGPSGSFAARGLAQLGYEVLQLEEHSTVGSPPHCTGIISADACRELGLESTVLEARLSRARFFSPRGNSFFVSAPEPRAFVVNRTRLDQLLSSEATASGVRLLLGARAHSVSVADGCAVVEAEVGGEPTSFRSRLAIIATGARSSLLPWRPSSRAGAVPLYAAQTEAFRMALTDVEIYMGSGLAPGGFAWAVPVDGKCRIGLIARQHPSEYLKRLVHTLEGRGAITRNGSDVAYHRIPGGPTTPSFSERVLAVGDAAGQVKTTTGGGIYFGFIGAQAAVQTADRAFRSGDVSSANLSRYEEIWLARLSAEQRLGQLLRKVQAALSDDDLELLFSLARSTRIREVLAQLHFDWHSHGVLRLLRDLVPGL